MNLPNPPYFLVELCLGTMNHAWIQILALSEKMTAKHLQMSLFPLVLDILPLLELHVPVCWHPPPEWMLERIEGRDILNCETGRYRCTVHMPKKWHKSIITQLQLQYSANWSANEHQITGFKFKALSKGFKFWILVVSGHVILVTQWHQHLLHWASFFVPGYGQDLPRPIPALHG